MTQDAGVTQQVEQRPINPVIEQRVTSGRDYSLGMPRLLYDRKTAAIQLSISVRALDYLIAQGKFNTRRIGKKVLIPHADLVRFAKADHFGSIRPPERDQPLEA